MGVSGQRYYDPRQGRFVGRDTMGEQGGLNLYGFCGNDAINLWDFLGMVVTTNPSIFAQNVFNRAVPIPYIAPGLFGGYDTSWLSFNWSTGAYNVTKKTQSFGDPRSGYTIYKGVQLPNIVWNGTPDQRNGARNAVDQFLNNLAANARIMTVAPQAPVNVGTTCCLT